MTLADLAEHATEEVTPISVDVGDLRVYECPPNGQVRDGRAACGRSQTPRIL